MNESKDIQSLLSKAFSRLKKENSLISLRALAQRLNLSPSYLSKLMRGEKTIPLHLVPSLQKGLHLDMLETKSLQRMILETLEEKSATAKTGIKSLDIKNLNLNDYKGFSKSDFLLLEKWYYIPLLNLVTVHDFQNDTEWISKKLGLTIRDVDAAIKILIRYGYLNEVSGQLVLSEKKARFPTDKSHENIRRYHQAMIKKATDELNTKLTVEDFQNRLISGISFAGDSAKIQQAQTILNQALYEVAELMSGENPDHVFQINLQFFKVTK